MEKILITGSMGQLGLELSHLLREQESYETLETVRVSGSKDIIELDITDEIAVSSIIDDFRPNIIINCAAMTAVDLCESQEDKAYKINALGPKYLALGAEKVGAKMIHISTDYVFDGQTTSPYIEKDPTGPNTVYGKTKLAGEQFVLENCSKSFVIRTAWLYGQGKNFPRTMLRLAKEGKDIKVVSDQYGSPTSALELARVVIYLMETECYGVYHASCEGKTSWYEFALKIFEEAGVEVSVEPIPTSQYPTPARRPMYSVLDNKALRDCHNYYMKEWKEAFSEFMADEMKKF